MERALHCSQWVWTDSEGRTQPAVTLFDGLFRNDNPYRQKVSDSYRQFAIGLRESQCFECHVPSNPAGMKRLVLLQTPVHAASEIKRALRDVEEGRMPQDDYGIEKSLDPQVKARFLALGREFDRNVDLAKEWERVRRDLAKK